MVRSKTKILLAISLLVHSTLFLDIMSADSAAGIIIVSDASDDITKYAQSLLHERLSLLAGCEYDNAPELAKIYLKVETSLEKRMGNEGFSLITDSDQATISAATSIGLRHGACSFIEWVMGHTTAELNDPNNVDIDFPVTKGQAREFLKNLPKAAISQKPFYSNRILELQLSLGVDDLIDTDKGVQKYNSYDGISGGYKESEQLWKDWCNWCARHKMNYITNWPYGTGNNYWEMAVESTTAKMSIYSTDEIARAAAVRERLFKYALDRGVKPLLMNYTPGAPNAAIRANCPKLLGKTAMKQYPKPFCLSNPAVQEVYIKQARAIMRTYPSLAGLHLRWAGESFPCNCDLCRGHDKELQATLLLKIVNAVRQQRKDTEFILSGFARWGGDEFLKSLPEQAVLQIKWGFDWEPTSKIRYSLDEIAACPRAITICQNMPTEEQQPIGGVLYKHQQNGMRRFVRAAKQVPNLTGWVIVLGEKDRDFITGTNFVAAARLNWDPLTTDVNGLIRNYFVMHYGKAAAEPVYKALDISQDVWEEYTVDFDGVVPFYVCSRFHDMFGIQRVQNLSPARLREGLAAIDMHSRKMQHAVELIRTAENTINPEGRKLFRDMLLQEQIFADFLESRKLLSQGFLAKTSRNIGEMTERLKSVQSIDKKILYLMHSKPNMADEFEMSGMSEPTHLIDNVNHEINDITKYISPENLASLNTSREIYCEPDKLTIAGDIGSEGHMSLAIPQNLDDIKKTRFYFTVENVGGERPGDEAEIDFLGTIYKVPPSGDGPHVFSFDLEPKLFSRIKSADVRFKLVGNVHGSKYTAQNGRLVFYLNK